MSTSLRDWREDEDLEEVSGPFARLENSANRGAAMDAAEADRGSGMEGEETGEHNREEGRKETDQRATRR